MHTWLRILFKSTNENILLRLRSHINNSSSCLTRISKQKHKMIHWHIVFSCLDIPVKHSLSLFIYYIKVSVITVGRICKKCLNWVIVNTKSVPSNISYKYFKNLLMKNSYCDHRNSVKPGLTFPPGFSKLDKNWLLFYNWIVEMKDLKTSKLRMELLNPVRASEWNPPTLVHKQNWTYEMWL
jgi:hypothetical protein